MIDFSQIIVSTMNASPQKICDIVSDLSRHAELPGSGELNRVTQEPAGPVEVGTRLRAEEPVVMADGSTMDLKVESVIVA